MAVAAQAGPVAAVMSTKPAGVMRIDEIIHAEPLRLLVLFDKGQEEIVRVVADVVGQAFTVVTSLRDVGGRTDIVVGLGNWLVPEPEGLRRTGRTVIMTHAIDENDYRDESATALCDYEYLYSSKGFKRRTISRYLGFILGQNKPHDDLKVKPKTTLLSTTFGDIRAALPNMDIMSVGADSIELRVDLLKDSASDGFSGPVPSVKYVGEQLMVLRDRTQLPIVFTTRCVKENGRFPMNDPTLFYTYLRKALQWGCEYIDVELWLPEHIRRKLALEKGNSKIISAWHDFSGRFRWTSAEARQLFEAGAVYGDIVKMIATVTSTAENYELEYFRSAIQAMYPTPPFSGLNMNPVGQLSRTLNQVFTPITHSLLPAIAAPGQLSAAEINAMSHSMGQLQKLSMYAIGNVGSNGQAIFFEKCLNELSLPHQIICLDNQSTLESILRSSEFGGAYLSPPLAVTKAYHLPKTTEAAANIGYADTIVASTGSSGRTLTCDNATWKGIRATLTRGHVPLAYESRPALVLANSENEAAAAIYALRSLRVGTIYTVGFGARNSHGQMHHFRDLADMKGVPEPFVMISALPTEKSMVVSPLLKHYSNSLRKTQRPGKVFLDLSNAVNVHKSNSVSIAAKLGWRSYGINIVNHYTMVETLRLLLGFNVGYDFVRLASGRCLVD